MIPKELLKDLINFETVTPNENGILTFLEKILVKEGFKCEQVTFPLDGGEEGHPTNYPVKNLYARYGTGTPVMSFCGHLDVVDPGDLSAWETNPFEAVEKTHSDGLSYIHGRGAEDMKSGVVAFICASINFIKKNPNFDGSIVFLITLDEEAVSINGIKALLEYLDNKGEKIDGCVVAEASSVNNVGDHIKIGSRGTLDFDITVSGKQGHVAYPKLFVNPNYLAAKLALDLQEFVFDNGNEYFEPTNLEIVSIDTGNNTYNVVPEAVKMIGNIRFSSEYTADSLKEKLAEILKNHPAASITFPRAPSDLFYVKTDSKIYQDMEKALLKVNNITPKPDTGGGTSDGRFTAMYAPTIEFGLCKSTLHQPNERVSVDQLNNLIEIYEEFLTIYYKG